MDDILSAALGQSGLNLSFLEGNDATNSDQVQPPSVPNTIRLNGHNLKPEPIDDVNEDVSDLLSLLSDADGTNDSKDGVTTGNEKVGNQNTPPYVFNLLKYESDDEENSVPTFTIGSNINSPCGSPSSFAGSLTTQFPKIKPPQHKNLITISRSMSPQTISKTIKKVTVKSQSPNATKATSNINILNKNVTSNITRIGNQTIVDKVSNNNKNIRLHRSATAPVITKLLEPTKTNELSDAEKRKKSIQHVLASPNLTVREKQFLMKSAISANLKTSIPSLSTLSNPTNTSSRGLSSLLQKSTYTQGMSNYTAAEEPDDDEENVLMHTETFADYMPAKVKVGYLHPDPVVETSSMASVAPPDVWYSLLLPRDVIDLRKLSALQLESIVYSSQQHEKLLPSGKRAGFLIGDGAGVGKGRTVAGVIFENYLHGRKRSIWLSVSNDLRFDAMRDLRDIGCHAKVVALNKFKYDEKITSKVNGKFKKGCIFATYSSLIGETSSNARFKSRLDQLLHWCGKDFDGVIVLDECHKAKNLMPVGSSKPTKTGLTVLKLQDLLPKARIVYCSATGASEPKNMAYMNRLGLWGAGTAFKEFSDFLSSVEKRGVGAMEMVAMDMKLRGMYIARQLSFAGVTFDVKEIKLCPSFIEMYDSSVKLWLDAREKFEEAIELVAMEGKGKKTIWGQFWSAHQRFFKYLCIAAKVKRAVEIAKEAIEVGKCIIFGLQSTGEARTLDQIDDLCGELNDFISTTKGVFSTLVEKHFPTTVNPNGQQSMVNNDDRKRKREWRKPLKQSSKRKKAVNGGIGYMSSSGSSDSEDENRNKSSNEHFSDIVLSDKEDSEGESESEERDPFKDSSSGSDDEDAWLRAASEKKPKKSKKIEKLTLKKINQTEDSSMNALAAAGLNLGRQYSWANAVDETPASTDKMKSNRSTKVSTPSGLTQQLMSVKDSVSDNADDVVDRCRKMKQNLLDQLEVIAPYLPPNTLDELIDELGGPEHVAEMTGRKGRVVAKSDGSFAYEPRSKDDVPLEVLNVAEKKRFMDGEKLVAVISEAASSGISLQADRREKNQRRRVHITLELPWSADKAIQQFGRSHRSNQVSAPQYLFLISELAGEQRFASIVAKRLESLGALTHGDRRATESRDLSRYNFDTKYGRQALDIVLKSIIGHEKPLVPPPTSYQGKFFDDVKKSLVGVGLIQRDEHSGVYSMTDKDFTNISRFLNRILGMTVALQNALFVYFTDSLAEIIKDAKRSGRFDEGIVDLGSQGESVVQKDVKTFLCPSTSGQVTSELITVSVERGLSFEKATEMCQDSKDPIEGFWLTTQLRNGRITAVLILKHVGSKKDMYSLYRPNIGLVVKPETIAEINKKYKKVSPEDAKQSWDDQYESSETNCSHAFWRGFCKKKICGLPCEVGARKRTCYILCGSVLSVWSKVETILSCQPAPYSKMQIIRSKLDNGVKLVGLLIPSNCIDALVKILSNDDSSETL